MGVKRLLIIVTTLLVCAMLFDGLYYKDAPLMWLASSSLEFTFIRVTLVAVLLSLFLSSPPRSVHFRMFLAGFAAILLVSTIGLSISYAINLLDTVIFTEVAIIFLIESLEADQVTVKQFGSKIASAK